MLVKLTSCIYGYPGGRPVLGRGHGPPLARGRLTSGGDRPSINDALYKGALSRRSLASPAHIRSTIAALAAAPAELRELRAYHKALADVTRLRIVQRLAESPATVTELITYVDLSQPLVSWHLRTLLVAGLVETRRSGREVICSLRRDVIDRYAHCQSELLEHARAAS